MPERIRLSRARGWRMPAGALKVDRSTPWGNPFVVGRDGTAAECVELYKLLLAGHVCLTCHATYGEQIDARRHVHAHFEELRGRDLACWCRLGAPCHADVLLEVVSRMALEAAEMAP